MRYEAFDIVSSSLSAQDQAELIERTFNRSISMNGFSKILIATGICFSTASVFAADSLTLMVAEEAQKKL